MKVKLFVLGFSFLMVQFVTGQDNKATLAVANPHVGGLNTQPELVAKMIRLELVKINKFRVYDEFDMSDVINKNEEFKVGCYGQGCLNRLGQALNVDQILCGSVDGLYNKIAVTIKLIDVKEKRLINTIVKEFDDQEMELQRMLELTLKELFSLEVNQEILARLSFKNELITSNNVGRINNSGPRVGYGYAVGALGEYAMRSERDGGLNAFPAFSMIGYQLEEAYVGTENFSALVEGILNISGLEQGLFIPSVTVLNGFRFEKTGWELAFGPGFGLKKVKKGFIDTDNNFGTAGKFYDKNAWYEYAYNRYGNDESYYTNGQFNTPSPTDVNSNYDFSTSHLHSDGKVELSTTFVFALGRTFRAGSLNMPVNAFYSAQKGGGLVGLNVGFNVQKKRTNINPQSRR